MLLSIAIYSIVNTVIVLWRNLRLDTHSLYFYHDLSSTKLNGLIPSECTWASPVKLISKIQFYFISFNIIRCWEHFNLAIDRYGFF